MEDAVKLKLKRVLEVFVEPSAHIKDDTCLNKLNDFLQVHLEKAEDVEECCIPNFLRCVSEKKTSTPVFVFGVHLVGTLASKPHLNRLYEGQIPRILQTALSHDLLVEPSVGEALFIVMRGIPVSLILSLNDVLSTTWKILQEKTTMFLTKSAVQFAISLLKNSNKSEESLEDLNLFLENICKHLCKISLLDEYQFQNESQFSCVCLDILREVMTMEYWNNWVAKHFLDLNDILLKILEASSGDVLVPCLQCVLTAAENNRSDKDFLEEFGVKMMNSVNKLLGVDILKTQEVCFGVMQSGLWRQHYEWMKMVVSLPLYLVSKDTVPEKMKLDLQNITRQITSRTKAVKIFCRVLEKVAVLQLKDEVLQEMVMKTFEMTTEDLTSEIQSYLQHSNKVQQKCLQLFCQDSSFWLTYCERILPIVIKICQNSRVDNVTYTKSLDCILQFLPHIIQQTCNVEDRAHDELSNLVFLLQRNICGISWEAREATLAFNHTIVTLYRDTSSVMSWFEDNNFDVSVWQCLSDSESYVRSTALDCLAYIMCCTLQEHLLKSLSVNLDDVVSRITNLCRTDTEAFVRRSAISFFTKQWKDNSLSLSENSKQEILTLLSSAMPKDFDWEVKLKVIEFWTQIIDQEFETKENLKITTPSYAVTNMQSETGADILVKGFCKLCTFGCFKALFSLIEDFDQSVVEKALLLLKNIKDVFEEKELTSRISIFLHENNVVKDSLEENELCNKRQKMDNGTVLICNGQKEEILQIIEKLMEIDVEQKLAEFSKTCDEYDRNPVSLLDDLLLYAKSHDNQDEDDSTVVDCY